MTVLVCVMLQYINLLLMMMAGAGLSTATLLLFFASSTKYPLRSPLLLECRVATAALTSVAATLTLLGLLLQAGLGAKTWRRPILITYSAMMAAVVCCEASAAAWLCWRLYLLVSDQRLVAAFSWNKICADIVNELTPDRPYVLYVAGVCAVFCAVLQCLAFLLAILASRSSASLGTVHAERQQSADRADNKTLLLSYMRSPASTPRCLRPLSGSSAEYQPTLLSKDKDSSRRSRRSRGWQLQPDVGWKQG